MGNAPFKWGQKEQAAFDKLKRLIASEEVTAQPRPIGKFRLEVDASGYALGGGVLSQLQDNKWCSVAFISCTMMDAELNYNIYNKELLAMLANTSVRGNIVGGVTMGSKGNDVFLVSSRDGAHIRSGVPRHVCTAYIA